MRLLRLERSILRRWPKAAAVTRSSVVTSQAGSRAARNELHDGRGDLGRRREGAPVDVEELARVGTPLAEDRKPAIGLAARRGDDALGHFLLEHQVSEENQGGQGPVSQPVSSGVAIL